MTLKALTLSKKETISPMKTERQWLKNRSKSKRKKTSRTSNDWNEPTEYGYKKIKGFYTKPNDFASLTLNYMQTRLIFKNDINSSIYKIPQREGGQSIIYKNNLVLFGGRVFTSPNFVIRTFDLTKHTISEKCQFQDLPLLGFSADRIEDKVYIFGGSIPSSIVRECVRSLYVWNGFSIDQQVAKNASLIVPRRNHGHAAFGHFLIISGGVDSQQKLLSDDFYYNTNKKKFHFNHGKQKSLGLAFHKMLWIMVRGLPHLIRFGGINSLDQYQGLYMMSIQDFQGQINLGAWSRLQGTGMPASPRIQHTFNFISKLQSLLVIGGRNSVEYYGISDIHLFNLDQYSWTKAVIVGDIYNRLYGHTSVYDGENSIYLFGGFINSPGTDQCFGSNRLAFIDISNKQMFTERFKEFKDAKNMKLRKINNEEMNLVRKKKQDPKNVYSINTMIKAVYQLRKDKQQDKEKEKDKDKDKDKNKDKDKDKVIDKQIQITTKDKISHKELRTNRTEAIGKQIKSNRKQKESIKKTNISQYLSFDIDQI